MLSKLVVVALFLAVSNSAYTGPLAGGQPAAQFPAGLDPQSCPNYPICENPSVAANPVPISQYNSQYQPIQYSQPQYNQAPQYQPQARYTSPQVPQFNLAQPAPIQIPRRHYNLAAPFTPNQAYNAVPQQYNNQQAQPQYSPQIQEALNRGEYIGDGDYHGEGLAESGAQAQAPAAPAYNPAAYQQAYSAQIPQVPYHGAQQQAQLPAGLAPGACPNYPFCQQ
ncbi:hypothetical protein WA026_002318 [Henosepilachna vigintioctopunctata]|uniref:Cuticle protein CPCFC domain-containing protein n=1 Tax=Henosepilachna vigintioctopunctata TaxID=420089 RepID=A0AAW1U022_9CUCU